jgi:molybdopterin biosynthesis enzyme MoaB
MNEQGSAITMSYSDISFAKPDASLFTPPTGFTKYDSMQEMMQSVMMKKMGGGMGFPPPQQ